MVVWGGGRGSMRSLSCRIMNGGLGGKWWNPRRKEDSVVDLLPRRWQQKIVLKLD